MFQALLLLMVLQLSMSISCQVSTVKLTSLPPVVTTTASTFPTPPQDSLVNYKALFSVGSPREGLSFIALAKLDGYTAEEFYVTTEDGYIIKIFYVHPHKNCTTIKRPVVMMHGLMLSSDDCIIPGPGKAICYLLADACYPIIVGNVRGNKYGRNHTILDPDVDKIFWHFDFEDMVKDVKSIITFVRNKTGQEYLYYCGHSQGVTILVLMCAMFPEFCKTILYVIGLSAPFWLWHARLPTLLLQAFLPPTSQVGYYAEIFEHGGITQQMADLACGTTNVSYPFCTFMIFALFGFNNFTISQETIAVATSMEPAGTSQENFDSWGAKRRLGFVHKDLGIQGNMKKYGCVIPPEYDLRKYAVPTRLLTSINDYLCAEEDLDLLLSKLPNCPNCSKCVVSNPSYGHIDWIYSDKNFEVMWPIMKAAFENGTSVCT